MLPVLPALVLLHLGPSRPLYHPSTADIAAAYKRADGYSRAAVARTAMLRLDPIWSPSGKEVWYRKDLMGSAHEFVRVDTTTGARVPAFDHARLAEALSKATGAKVTATTLPFRTLQVIDRDTVRFDVDAQGWKLDLTTYTLTKTDATPRPRPVRTPPWRQDVWPPAREPQISPDGKWTARIENRNILIKPADGPEVAVTTDGTESAYYARLRWSSDSSRLMSVRVHPGDRKHVYLIQNSPPQWGPVVLSDRIYDRPGDKVDTFDILTIDPATKKVQPIDAEPIDYGGMPDLRPTHDGKRYVFDKMDRGYGRWRVFALDPSTGKAQTIIDDDPPTFVDSTAQITEYLDTTDEIIYSSEKDGWHHLYIADGKGGSTQITKGSWVVRGVTKVDEKNRQIIFTASGMDPNEDPYFIHYYRINFDGTNLVPLSPGLGTHTAQFSPDFSTFIDTYSSAERAPVHELRRSDNGALVASLEKGDISDLLKSGWKAPKPFVAKGRDGQTDIYGLVYRPSNFDPRKRYPIVEDIYAGPQDSFVPKAFTAGAYDQTVAELGFIVVKIDGMGTRNRSKAFHDVCYKNLADAGFSDRILWMKALAKVEPSADIDRVGIFGTSAGGQNAGGAVLFHPEFYKVAVASCGCHDNRLDKIWWNEQWMGLMGPHYAASSNIDNAAKLQGDLLLMVGELDTNVPPESTFRFAAALQAAGKEYDLVVIPNSDHTAGGPYGERKRRDFLVRHLLEVEPPNPNH